MPPDLVIFDCDGVLVDTERLSVPIDAAVLAELGWPMSKEEVVERFLGRADADNLREIEAHLGRSLQPAVTITLDRRYRQAFERELTAVPGVETVLDALDRAAIPACVASSGSHEKMQFTLGLTRLLERFEGRIFSADEVSRGKPAPDLFLYAATRLRTDPARCAVVEDSPSGIEAALAAGMAAYAFGGGLAPMHRLVVPGAVVFGDMSELPALLGL